MKRFASRCSEVKPLTNQEMYDARDQQPRVGRTVAAVTLAAGALSAAAITANYASLAAHFSYPSNLTSVVVANFADPDSIASEDSRADYTPFTIRPADFLLEEVTAEDFYHEADLMWSYVRSLERECSSLGIDRDTILSEEEIQDDAERFFDILEELLGQAEMPGVVAYPEEGAPGFTIDTVPHNWAGRFHEGTAYIFTEAETVLSHELTHTWMWSESWTEILSNLALQEMADQYWDEYLSTGDSEIGRRACIYRIGLWESMSHEWNAAGHYLERLHDGADYAISDDLLAYDIVPALALRHAFRGDDILEYEPTMVVEILSSGDWLFEGLLPGWDTHHGQAQNIDFSPLAGSYDEIMMMKKSVDYDPVDPLKPEPFDMPMKGFTNYLVDFFSPGDKGSLPKAPVQPNPSDEKE